MYSKASDVKYGFARFAVPWGRKYSDFRMKLEQSFKTTMRQFAKECGIMYLNGDFYYFNGKVYEKVSLFSISEAYEQLLERLGINDMSLNKTFRNDIFINTIKAYNELHVRNDIQAFKNKVVDLRTVGLKDKRVTHPFSPDFHVIDYHPYNYDPLASAPIFNRFLREVLPDATQRHILQMFLGLGLVQSSDVFDKDNPQPRNTVEICLLLLGNGANGKSVLFNVICALFGKSHISNIDYDTMTADGDEGLRGRATIRSAVFNWSSDSDAKKFGKKNTAMFKRIVSGESYPYRLLGHDIDQAEQCPYLIFNLNEAPLIEEGTNGFMRRLQFVNFDVTIPKFKQDPNLANKIINKELPGVFNWVVRGSREIRRRHFKFPDSTASLRSKLRSLLPSNPVYAWVRMFGMRPEPLAPGELSVYIKAEKLYGYYQKFSEINDLEELTTVARFGRSLSAMKFTKMRKVDGYYYLCYGVTEEQLGKPVSVATISDNVRESVQEDKDSFIKYD